MSKIPPSRGSSSRIFIGGQDWGRGFEVEEAPEEFQTLAPQIQSATSKLESYRPRYRLPLGQRGHIGLRELAWLDERHALKLLKCKAKDTRIAFMRDGTELGQIRMKIREIPKPWSVAGFKIQVESHYCGRQNKVLLTVEKD